MFHTLAYTLASDSTSVNADMTAATDPEISTRNNHYILTEDYNLLLAFASGKTATRFNIYVPQFNAVSLFNIWPINSDTICANPPRVDCWLPYQPMLPRNEEIQVRVTDTAADRSTVFLWIATSDWTQNLPRGIGPVPVFECRVTASPTGVANTWSTLYNITFEQSLRGGTYAVVGAQWQGTGVLVVRLVFPRAPMYHNRKLRPGVLASNALGDQPMQVYPWGPFFWGQHGRFSTFEPPQIEIWANASGAVTLEGRLWLVRISEDANVVY